MWRAKHVAALSARCVRRVERHRMARLARRGTLCALQLLVNLLATKNMIAIKIKGT